MSTVEQVPEQPRAIPKATEGGTALRKKSIFASIFAALIAILWTIPTLGLLITSFRPQIDALSSGWWTVWKDPNFTLDNYKEALFGGSTALSTYFINSFVITIPGVIVPICIAALAAYGFAWVRFRASSMIFIAVFALQIVPIQVTMIPLLKIFVGAGLSGTFWPIWIAHSIFALPLAIYLLHNFMSELPRELFEAAKVDGAGHLTIFFKILLPLMLPAIAAFAIFQFLWVWNDLLVALTFGASPEVSPLTVRIAELSGTRGSAWHLVSAGAFIAMVVPLIVFLSMQRYFVRGLLAGSVKG